MLAFSLATAGQRPAALRVWRAANIARGLPPSSARAARVHEKIRDQSAFVVVGRKGNRVVAMALVEPGREQHGRGAVRPGVGHVSMVFVDPERWGQGIGKQLLDAVHREMRSRGWTLASLWTRSSNLRARRLYEGRGYRNTGDVETLARGDEIIRYQYEFDEADPG